MAGTKEIKRRIKSVKNTKKITKAMELVAASKMKRAVSSTLASRLYAEYSWEILSGIAKSIEKTTNPLFIDKTNNLPAGRQENILLILITSNRGLCGAYNAQVIKKAVGLLRNENSNINIDIISVGKKGDAGMRRIGRNVIASFVELSENISLNNILPISSMVVDEYKSGRYDKVLVAYTDFVSALTQRPNIKQLLPISKTDLKDLIEGLSNENIEESKTEQAKTNYLFEGNIEELLGSLAEKLTRMQIYQMMLESNASEQSSRMVAMKNASEASGEMIDDLTLVFNKARQSNITREISEISAGMASMS